MAKLNRQCPRYWLPNLQEDVHWQLIDWDLNADNAVLQVLRASYILRAV